MDAPNRLVTSMVGLAALWVAVYWLWPAEPPVRFAVAADGSRRAIEPPPPALQAADRVRIKDDPAQPNPAQPNPAQPNPVAPPRIADNPIKAPPDAREAILPPRFKDYLVKKGDTLAAIAQRELGDAKHADAIAQANQLMSPAHLRADRTIRIPLDPTNTQGVLVRITEDGSRKRVQAKTPTLPTSEYVVRTGDTLAGISKRVYGSESHTQELIDANKDTLPDPSRIRPGQRIRVPQLAPVNDTAFVPLGNTASATPPAESTP